MMTYLKIVISALLISVPFSGCKISGSLDANAKDLADKIGDIKICNGMTLKDLAKATKISDECKADLQGYLPHPEQNFEDRIVVLGTEEETDGSLSIYLHGADSSGVALDSEDYGSLSVSVDGTVIAKGKFTITATAELSGKLMSLGIVNDYSGSMSESDLDTVAEIETDIVTYLPPIYEAEVTFFSTEVSVKQSFTSDQKALLAAVARDETFKRDLTALYDGMGTALESLTPRKRPIRLLIVSTDGAENKSTKFEKPEIIKIVTDAKIPVVMLGALFADIDEIKDLMGPNGVYFYTPYYDDLKDQVEQYIDSLSEMIAVNVPPEYTDKRPIEITVDDVTVTIE